MENLLFETKIKVEKQDFYNVYLDYSHKIWDVWVLILIEGENGETLKYVRPLTNKKERIETTVCLFEGENKVAICAFGPTSLAVNGFFLSENKPNLTTTINPSVDYFYLDDPKNRHAIITSYFGAPVSVSCEGKALAFEVKVAPVLEVFSDGIEDPLTTFHLYFNADDLKTLGVGKHVIKIGFEKGTETLYELNVLESAKDYNFKVVCFDVYHGNSVLVCLPNGKNLLIDTGVASKTKDVVIPYLEKHNVKPDYFLITHFHEDHEGGADQIIDRYGFKLPDAEEVRANLKKGEERIKFLSNYNFFNSTCLCRYDRLDKIWDLGGVEITVLNSKLSENGDDEPYSPDENSTSVSLLIKYNGFGYYHGSDNYVPAQRKNLEDFTARGKEKELSCQFMLANHHFHGDVFTNLIKAINPVAVVVPTNESAYARSAYVHDFVPDIVFGDFEGNRFKDTLISYSSGTVIAFANSGDDWHYETY